MQRPGKRDGPVMVTVKDLAWAAGFLEGEGAFLANTGTGFGVGVMASQVQKEPLDRIANLFGGNVYFRPRTLPSQNIHTWGVYGFRAIAVAMTMYSMMSPRRKEQIQRMIRIWHERPEHRSLAKKACPRGHPYDAENTIRYQPRHRRCRACIAIWNKARRIHPDRLARKLTQEDVVNIRDAAARGVTQKTLAAIFTVCSSSINHIVKRRRWRRSLSV